MPDQKHIGYALMGTGLVAGLGYLGWRVYKEPTTLGGLRGSPGSVLSLGTEPMRYFVMEAVEDSTAPLFAPTRPEIEAALGPRNLGWPAGAGWLGPAPRIVRRSSLGSAETRVCWVLGVPEHVWHSFSLRNTDPIRQLEDNVRTALTRSLRRSTDWVLVSFSPWDQSRNGLLSWWRSGDAAITHTRDEFPGLVLDTTPQENPIGPDDERLRPRGVFADEGGSVVDQLGKLMKSAAWVFVPVAVVVGIGAISAYVPPRAMPWNWEMWKGGRKPDALPAGTPAW